MDKKEGKSLGMSHPLIAVVYVLAAYMLPVINAALTIVLPIIWHISTTLSDVSLFVIYFISVGLLWFLNKSLGLKKVSDEDNIISKRGFVKTFPPCCHLIRPNPVLHLFYDCIIQVQGIKSFIG